MTSAAYAPVPIGPDEYRIPGITPDRLRRALALLVAAEDLQGEIADERRDRLVQTLMVAGIDPVPDATLRQAQRLARHRERLLATGAYTIEALAALHGDRAASATRTWLARRRRRHELFTLTHEGATLVPAFQLDEHGEPRKDLALLLRVLGPAGLSGWQLWTWLTSPAGWLSGDVPADVVTGDPDRAVRAAEQFASNLAGA